jgi:MFS family permease
VLGPALPFIRAAEQISYLVAALHQAAYAIGGGLAGLLATRAATHTRKAVICGGLLGAAVAGLLLGYGRTPSLTILAALLASLFGTSALIRIWAALSDIHAAKRAVALSEGEVSVSLAGILTPLLISALASTAVTWRFGFVIGGITVIASAAAVALTRLPAPAELDPVDAQAESSVNGRPTLIIVLAVVALEFAVSFWLASYLNDAVGIDRDLAVAMVSGLYAANLLGRLIGSRLARRFSAQHVLAGTLAVSLIGLPVLLLAGSVGVAAIGIVVTGAGIGAAFPLVSALHIEGSPQTADYALGQILAIAALGQLLGPLSVGALAEVAGLRAGFVVAPALALAAGVALIRRNQVQTATTTMKAA